MSSICFWSLRSKCRAVSFFLPTDFLLVLYTSLHFFASPKFPSLFCWLFHDSMWPSAVRFFVCPPVLSGFPSCHPSRRACVSVFITSPVDCVLPFIYLRGFLLEFPKRQRLRLKGEIEKIRKIAFAFFIYLNFSVHRLVYLCLLVTSYLIFVRPSVRRGNYLRLFVLLLLLRAFSINCKREEREVNIRSIGLYRMDRRT